MKGISRHVEEFGFYSRNNGELLKGFGSSTVVIRFALGVGHSDGSLEGGFKERGPRGRETARQLR